MCIRDRIFFVKRASKCLKGLYISLYMLAITKKGFLVAARKTCKPRVFKYMDILNFHMSVLETSNMGGDKQSMSVCANANDRLANQDHTPRWLNLISGA